MVRVSMEKFTPIRLESTKTMIILVAVLMPESIRGGCINHPEQADVFGATAVEDMCDGRQKYVRRPSHETRDANVGMA